MFVITKMLHRYVLISAMVY